MKMRTNPKSVDVVIPVYRPDEKLERILEMLKKQTVSVGKLILMVTKDEGQEEKEKSQAEGFSGWIKEDSLEELRLELHTLDKSDFNHGLTRNEGAGYSQADIIVFMTDDAVPADEYLIERLLFGLSDERTAVCYARQLPAKDAGLAERFSREYNYPSQSRTKTSADLKEMGIKAFFCSNVCAAYKSYIYRELGGFTKTIFNEDMIFARKVLDAGYAIRYQGDALVVHSHNFTNMQQFRRNYDLAISQKVHPEVFSDVSSEKEGLKYVRKAYGYFREQGKGFLILPFLVTCGFRFLGYRLGKRFG